VEVPIVGRYDKVLANLRLLIIDFW